MTPGEFKAWFDGFTEAFEGRIPTKAQWGRIKDRVAEIDGKPITERIYVDRWWPYYNSIVSQPIRSFTTTGVVGTTGISLGSLCAGNAVSNSCGSNSGVASSFCSSQAMNELGRAEAASLAA